jgi:hypothetical protein
MSTNPFNSVIYYVFVLVVVRSDWRSANSVLAFETGVDSCSDTSSAVHALNIRITGDIPSNAVVNSAGYLPGMRMNSIVYQC